MSGVSHHQMDRTLVDFFITKSKGHDSYVYGQILHLISIIICLEIIMAGQQTEILQKLEKMGNLEAVVTEQKIRIEKLRTTYETLKAEHLQLQDVSFCRRDFLQSQYHPMQIDVEKLS